MRFTLQKIEALSGMKASCYSVVVENEEKSLFEKFLEENSVLHKDEILDILARLNTIAQTTGIRRGFFKEFEGNPGDGVCALYDEPSRKLRLYCILFGEKIIVLGGGGRKSVQKLQQDAKLKAENFLLREVSKTITRAIITKETAFTDDMLEFTGDLIF
ncbi:MAG: hypothetical protein HRU80_16535 [Ignavibacteriales bacterium]|nr:hypothetical protein [Ignavibacteriaceae bacterium]MCK6615234.1 hypothetical protein [Ignavibacteriaceae bacterium]QOJ30390.1 MAG: hypothetical protein HRU80_16535 [Ignavibacteriales bacterium]